MNQPVIGVKLADRTLFPVLEEGHSAKKKLVLTTVRENQLGVKIDLFRGTNETVSEAEYIGTISIDDIHYIPGGKPEIELVMSLDSDGNLIAKAHESASSDEKSLMVQIGHRNAEDVELSISKPDYTIESTEAVRIDEEEFSLDKEFDGIESPTDIGDGDYYAEQEVLQESHKQDLNSLAPESYSRPLYPDRGNGSPRIVLFLAGFIIGMLLFGIIGYFFILPFFTSETQAIPPLSTQNTEAIQEQLVPDPEPPTTNTPPAATTQSPVRPAAPSVLPEKVDIYYTSRRGDTLWDMSGSFYEDPTQYEKIVDENNIEDPDFILEGQKLRIPDLDFETEN